MQVFLIFVAIQESVSVKTEQIKSHEVSPTTLKPPTVIISAELPSGYGRRLPCDKEISAINVSASELISYVIFKQLRIFFR